MRSMTRLRVSLVSLLVVTAAPPAAAQTYESVGTRAQGMGGAFVAVADDATATWWNPAGMATGAVFSSIGERTEFTDPSTPPVAGPARRDTANSFTTTLRAFGVSYYRLRVSEIRPTAQDGSGRIDQGSTSVDLNSRSFTQLGVTIGQSLSPGAVIGATVYLLHAGVSTSTEPASANALDHADDADVTTDTHGDVDLGAMLVMGPVRLGGTMKHVTEPHFGSGDHEIAFPRQTRVGAAVIATPGKTTVTLSADADLTKTPTATGDVRHLAFGGEAWIAQQRIGLRGGVNTNTVGSPRTSTSAGLSLGIARGLYIDGAFTFGGDASRDGWGIGLRATY
jgi:hypothetical protein